MLMPSVRPMIWDAGWLRMTKVFCSHLIIAWIYDLFVARVRLSACRDSECRGFVIFFMIIDNQKITAARSGPNNGAISYYRLTHCSLDTRIADWYLLSISRLRIRAEGLSWCVWTLQSNIYYCNKNSLWLRGMETRRPLIAQGYCFVKLQVLSSALYSPEMLHIFS